ncbi:MAG: GLPGLI family protein, partial [Ferruginibacter sp.]|nr:GLPGLI family protein [Ferruginibacter sp.]
MNYKGFVFFFCCFHCWDNYAVAQNKLPGQSFPNEALVIYNYKSNGKNIEGRTLFLAYKNNLAILTDSNSSGNEGRIIDFNKKATFQTIRMKNGEKFTLKNPFPKYERPTITGDTASILGIPCRKAKLVIRSNSIEVWFTNAIQVKGTPSLGIAPGLGLILKIVRNGNFEIYASKIELGKVPDSLWQKPGSYGRIVDEATFRRKEIDNRYFSFPVFDHQQINFTDSISNPVEGLANVTYRYAGGTVVLKKVKLPDTEDFNVFINLTQYSNGDAYDRTGTVFIIPTDKKISFLNGLKYGIKELPVYTDKSGHKYQGLVSSPDYSPPLELIRFFTPFVVRAYNGNV